MGEVAEALIVESTSPRPFLRGGGKSGNTADPESMSTLPPPKSSRSCLSADGHPETMKMKSSLPTSGSADPRFWGPRFFRGTIDKPRTPTTGVRATQPVDFH